MKAKHSAKAAKDEKIYWGTEPSKEQFLPETDPEFLNSLSEFLNAYNFIATPDDKKEWFLTYIRNHTNISPKQFETVSVQAFKTAGTCARLFLRGLNYSEYLNNKLEQFQNSLQMKPTSELPRQSQPIEKSGGDLRDPRLSVLIGLIDIVIDEFIDGGYRPVAFEMTQWLVQNNPSPTQHLALKTRFRKMLDELNLIGTDEFIAEGYSHLKNLHRRRFIELLTQIVETKKFRKIRVSKTRKAKSPEKLTAKVRVGEKDEELGLTSISPAKIIGADGVWVWNKKYRVLGFYKAMTGKDLSVKGSTIMNFDQKLSTGKRIRKPKEIVTKVVDMGKVELKKLLAAVKAKAMVMNGRLGKDTIILRVL